MLVEIRRFSLGLEQLGLKAGDKVAIIGNNRPRLYWTFAAVQAIGGVPVPVYADSVAEEMGYVLDHAGIRFAVCQDQEQVDKVLSLQDTLDGLEFLIYDEDRGLREYDKERVIAFDYVQTLGDQALERHRSNPNRFAVRHVVYLRHDRQAKRRHVVAQQFDHHLFKCERFRFPW